jgi:hypothetical protein
VNCVSPILKQFADFRVVVAFIHAHVLRLMTRRFRSLYRDTLQGGFSQLHIMPICAIHCESNGYAVSFHEEASFCSRLPPVCWVWACAFSPQAALWSSLRPWPATSILIPSRRHTRSILSSIGVGRVRPCTTLGSGRGWCLMRRSFSVSPSIGIRFVARRRLRSSRAYHPSSGDRSSS